jgi:hypothetical protein
MFWYCIGERRSYCDYYNCTVDWYSSLEHLYLDGDYIAGAFKDESDWEIYESTDCDDEI